MRLTDRFEIFVATVRVVNPITQTNSERTGVEPDVNVPANLALKTAHLAAMQSVRANTTNAERTQELLAALATVSARIRRTQASENLMRQNQYLVFYLTICTSLFELCTKPDT